ncbi:heavy metal-responsive transcriptional regulator [Paraglaciecola aquimarina]|uniref:Heavy metal-responsive transcriptional regulator n=1 Tax=Paraglaciecola algarum TaxID=3050085 RepID=A0ABS9D3M7_9ALTE|nr:heavy metal-responsive transcriptional regulator [Paraglaciecola sp. G1-23]MCF2947536.1 heavy metal-responsive transcriptional regulator [Paraglaciecola sp. G1-23]
MKISELEKRTGINAHTLRYYEKSGLLKASMRSVNNYRIYSEDDLITALFIKRCKECGFSLAQTAALLAIKHDKSLHVCAEAKSITESKLQEISQQIEQLQQMEGTLTELQAYCCGGQESAEFCTIISTLEAGK